MSMFDFAKSICQTIKDADGEAYWVGGCVRDIKLHKRPKDIDIATNLLPDRVIELFSNRVGIRVVPIGKRFGTVQIIDAETNEIIEVTTYRSEASYTDRRHPDQITFVSFLEEDLARRDFTINAIAYDPIENIFIDPYGGLKDIENKIIRAVGVAMERFEEDPLRILRMIRFASVLNFNVEAETLMSAQYVSQSIQEIPYERVWIEILKIFGAKNVAKGIDLLLKTDVMRQILPEVTTVYYVKQPNEYHEHRVGPHMKRTAVLVSNYLQDMKVQNPLLVFEAFIHDIGKLRMNDDRPYFPNHVSDGLILLDYICVRLKISMEEREYLRFLMSRHMDCFNKPRHFTRASIRRYLSKVENKEWLFDLRIQCLADIFATGQGMKEDNIATTDNINDWFAELFREMLTKPALATTDLAIDGHDLLKLGIPARPILGRIQKKLLDKVLTDPRMNTKEILLVEAKAMFEKEMNVCQLMEK